MKIRLLEISEPKYPYKFKKSSDAYRAVKDYGRADREVFLVLFLNANNQVLDCEPLTVGSVGQAAIYIGEILRGAVLNNAVSIIVAHNHPGGGVTPSPEDLNVTAGIMLACKGIGMGFLDHLIISSDFFYSMADSGDIPGLQKRVERAMNYIEGYGGTS